MAHSEAVLRETVRARLLAGQVIPAMPLALDAARRLDERRQRALIRYYLAAGAGGLACGVHTTQFAIRDPRHGLFRAVVELAAEELRRGEESREPLIKIGGVCGPTRRALAEASTLRACGYDAGLLSLAALTSASEEELLEHARAVGEVLPIFGFYLQPAVGGRALPYRFWRRLCEQESLVAIKIAPFNRYATLDVVRAVAESGREDVVLYTGNDDQIVMDLLTPYRFRSGGRPVERRIVGGLLGHWSVWTRSAVALHRECREVSRSGGPIPVDLIRRAIEVTDCNSAFFDAANGFAGCIAGLHEVLRRQGLLEGTWCLDTGEELGPGQADEIDRVSRAYPHLSDDEFVAEHRDDWLNG